MNTNNPKPVIVSLPSWERGLKYIDASSLEAGLESLPSWERGLKYQEWSIWVTY